MSSVAVLLVIEILANTGYPNTFSISNLLLLCCCRYRSGLLSPFAASSD